MMKIHCILFVLFLFVSCSLPVNNIEKRENDIVNIILPEIPDGVKKFILHEVSENTICNIKFRVSWIESNGNKKSIETNENNISIEVQKNFITPFLVDIIFSYPNNTLSFFYPAGALYPFDKQHNQNIIVSWEYGFEASIIYQILSNVDNIKNSAYYLLHFNWKKLHEYIKKYDNPWELDKTLIIESIVYNNFSVQKIKKRESEKIIIDLPQSYEKIYSQYILNQAIDIDSDNKNNTIIIYEGISQFLLKDGIIHFSKNFKKTITKHFTFFEF